MFILIPTSMRACVCVCYLTGFSPNSSAPCRAVTAHSAVVAGATRIRKNNMKQFKKPCRREKGKESERDYLISFSACHANWRLSSPPVGDGRGEVGRVHGPEKKKKHTCHTNPHNRSVNGIRPRSAIGAKTLSYFQPGKY